MTLREKQSLFLYNVALLIKYTYDSLGYELTAGELYRTQEQQDWYWEHEMTKVQHSKHQDRLAIDLNLFIEGTYVKDKESYKPLADYWKTLHPENRAGYDWGWDANHFEMK
jgi:hypothetical protein